MASIPSAPSCLCFSRPPTLFLQGLRFLNQVYFLLMGSLSILFPSMLLSGDSQEDTNGALSSSFFHSFLLRWIYLKLSVLIISLSSFKCYPMPVPLIIVHLSLFLFGVLKISRKIRVSILNQFKLFGDYYLIQVI